MFHVEHGSMTFSLGAMFHVEHYSVEKTFTPNPNIR